jgi:hypothetical protein
MCYKICQGDVALMMEMEKISETLTFNLTLTLLIV